MHLAEEESEAQRSNLSKIVHLVSGRAGVLAQTVRLSGQQVPGTLWSKELSPDDQGGWYLMCLSAGHTCSVIHFPFYI